MLGVVGYPTARAGAELQVKRENCKARRSDILDLLHSTAREAEAGLRIKIVSQHSVIARTRRRDEHASARNGYSQKAYHTDNATPQLAGVPVETHQRTRHWAPRASTVMR